MGSTQLNINHTVANYNDRHSLFGSRSMSFSGETNTPTVTTTTAPFTVNFTDACRTSTITAKTITLTPVEYDVTS